MTDLLFDNTTFQPVDGLQLCIDFLDEIGITCTTLNSVGNEFLPGLSIAGGKILIDKLNLKFPGDILHEAGHIAVVPAVDRTGLNANSIAQRENREAEEMMAIAWSYAACVHLRLHPYFVFHSDGYKGGGQWIADNFMNDQNMGVPMLQWVGLTADKKNAGEMGIEPFPRMIKWLRD